MPFRRIYNHTMKSLSLKLIVISALLFIVFSQLLTAQTAGDGAPLPPPTAPVNDYANVIDDATERSLNERLIEFKKTSSPSVEIAVVTVRTTGGRQIFDYSLAVARGWGIGSKAQDNPGLLLLVAIDDRKYFTQTSRDIEGLLPDGLVGSIQRQFLVPEFKKSNYGKGIEDTVNAYVETIEAKRRGETAPVEAAQPEYQKDFVDRAFDAIPNWVCRGFCILIAVLVLISIFAGGGKSGRGRGSGGGGSGLASALIWAALSSASSSGSSSSGWSGGSSSDWGGFGGGGDFGGGGAGGDW